MLANRHQFLAPSSLLVTCHAMSSTISSGSEHMLAMLSGIRVYLSLLFHEGKLRNLTSVLM